MLWECSPYMVKLEQLGDTYADFELLNNVEKRFYVLGSVNFGRRISRYCKCVGNKKCMAMTYALVNFCLSPRLGIWGISLRLIEGQRDGTLGQIGTVR